MILFSYNEYSELSCVVFLLYNNLCSFLLRVPVILEARYIILLHRWRVWRRSPFIFSLVQGDFRWWRMTRRIPLYRLHPIRPRSQTPDEGTCRWFRRRHASGTRAPSRTQSVRSTVPSTEPWVWGSCLHRRDPQMIRRHFFTVSTHSMLTLSKQTSEPANVSVVLRVASWSALLFKPVICAISCRSEKKDYLFVIGWSELT